MVGMADTTVPPYTDLLFPTMLAVASHGGSASIDEIFDTVAKLEAYNAEQQAVLHHDGPQTEIAYRLGWARSYLKVMGVLNNSRRGVWALTEAGREIAQLAVNDADTARTRLDGLLASAVAQLRAQYKRRRSQTAAVDNPDGTDSDDVGSTWKEELLDALTNMPPDKFEHLAQRLLREAGFVNATVTGRSGDGGIDGLGVYRLSLVSFPVFFQCKRYKGSVGSGAVRDFRGAMAGRGDKGLLITTGTFTADAKNEATRDGAPPIDLIDGDRLCDLLKEYELGLHVSTRVVEDIHVDIGFLNEL